MKADMTLTVEIPDSLETSLTQEAEARGVAPALVVREALEHRFAKLDPTGEKAPFKSGLGMWKKYGFTLSEADIDENRADMCRNFGENF